MQGKAQILLDGVKRILVSITTRAHLDPVRQPTGGLVVIDKDREHLKTFAFFFFILIHRIVFFCHIFPVSIFIKYSCTFFLFLILLYICQFSGVQ